MTNDKNLLYLKVNEPNVVHETIEGETILLNLATGNYYSIEWPGTVVWDLLADSGDVKNIRKKLLECNPENESRIQQLYSEFIDKLLEEELVFAVENQEGSPNTISSEIEKELSKIGSKLEKFRINKYSDMQDMLLLDPIHDVDEKGWPEPKKDD